jgi:hypothetical protein
LLALRKDKPFSARTAFSSAMHPKAALSVVAAGTLSAFLLFHFLN